MRCNTPFVSARGAFACGRCTPCRHNRRRMWVHRLLLEAMCHEVSSFVTVTYADDPWSLSIRDYQLFLKRLRKAIGSFRYFIVGEYGDRSGRPHYHLALFGHGCTGSLERTCSCQTCSAVRETWKFGHTLVLPLEVASCMYLGGYVLKKMTHREDVRLVGREPEFARMSLRPFGIGADAMWDVASEMLRLKSDEWLSDVPAVLGSGDRHLPLGRYLRGVLRERIGREKKAPECSEALRELQLVREYAFTKSESVQSVLSQLAAGDTPYKERGSL